MRGHVRISTTYVKVICHSSLPPTDLCYVVCGTVLSKHSTTDCSSAAEHKTELPVLHQHPSLARVCTAIMKGAHLSHLHTHWATHVHCQVCMYVSVHTWTSKNLRYLCEEGEGNILTSSPHLLTCRHNAYTENTQRIHRQYTNSIQRTCTENY